MDRAAAPCPSADSDAGLVDFCSILREAKYASAAAIALSPWRDLLSLPRIRWSPTCAMPWLMTMRAMVEQDVGVARNREDAVFERGLEARHLLAIPLGREHHLRDARAVALPRGFGEILSVAARIHRAADQAAASDPLYRRGSAPAAGTGCCATRPRTGCAVSGCA